MMGMVMNRTSLMKKTICLCILVLIAVFNMTAQAWQLATLYHNGNISTFYGIDAFVQAYDKSTAGDVITLSSGQFKAVDINKNLTVRGANMGLPYDNLFNSPTVISGDFKINVAESENKLKIEGVQCPNTITFGFTNSITITKSKLSRILVDSNKTDNVQFIHCVIEDGVTMNSNTNYEVLNSVINESIINFRGRTNCKNCVINMIKSSFNSFEIFAENCIFWNTGGSTSAKLSESSVIYNSVWIGNGATNPFGLNGEGSVNHKLTNVIPFIDGTFYEITEPLKAYKGTDGTDIGIYGGNLPFSTITTNPHIRKFNVSPRTTADGKLSVEIEVETGE